MRRTGALAVNGAARWLRGHWPDHNPLRRATDRAEAAVTAFVLLVFLAAAPFAAMLAVSWVARSGTAIAQTRYHVPAVLLATVPRPTGSGYEADVPVLAPARWSVPGGPVRTGDVLAAPGTRAGRSIMIWITASGRLARPPVDTGGEQPMAALTAVIAVATLAWCASRSARWTLDRRRMAAWDAEWQETGPRWSHRR